MRCIPFLLILFIASCSTPKEEKKIRVSGEGKVRVMPDLVFLTLDVSFTQPRMVDAVRQTQSTVDSVVQILQQFGRKDLDIKTSSISANKDYRYVGSREVFSGYNAHQSIDFVLNDISQFTALTGKLLETKINSISNIQFWHSKADSLYREADLLAYDDAFKSANKLCDRATIKLGKLIFLSNTESDPQVQQSGGQTYSRIDTYNKAFGGRGFRIAPEVLEFRRNIVSEYSVD